MTQPLTPRIIHQTWKTQSVPHTLREYAESCKRVNPSYAYRMYTDSDLRDIIVSAFPQYIMAYDGFAHNIERVDFARYAILYTIGGVYADLDMQCVSPFDKYVALSRPVFGDEPVEHRDTLYGGRSHVICNALMISPPKQQIWLDIMDWIVQNYNPTNNPVYNTGPMALTLLYESIPSAYSQSLITSACEFYSQTDRMTTKTQQGIPYISMECNNDQNQPVAVHRWAHTWIPQASQNSHDKVAHYRRYITYGAFGSLLITCVVLFILLYSCRRTCTRS